ncbi:hypothetical protein RclHR1_03470012 [Rhizophagus clarus]|nr:hypothetical protein RclHR1_03470012 [Rhizophagus clarus]
MIDTSSPIVPDMNELQNIIIKSVEQFSFISKLKIKNNNFIQEKIEQISHQRVEFRKFAEESISQSLKMCSYAKDLIAYFGDNYNKDELLESLKPLLNDINLYELEATLLKKQLKEVKDNLNEISKEIFKYDVEITEKREKLSETIIKTNKLTDDAWSWTKGGFIAAGIGSIVAVAAAPFTAGASLAAVPIAEAVIGIGGLTFITGTATATFSTAVAGTSAIASGILNYQLKSVREEFSKYIQEMQNALGNISVIISHCESHWEKQIIEIKYIIEKLEGNDQQITKPNSKSILARAGSLLTSSERYSVVVRQAVNLA